ncbi:hypothetical protein ONZ45_g8300 [Pleurotus djamor]|nr:hypothetical protein ONZ45_g8300 [Pleurotus djamor]
MSLLPIPLRPNYIQPPQPDGATHVYGFVLSDKVAEEVALQFDPNPTAEHVPYLPIDGYMQVNMYCQLKFQDYHLQWRRPVLGLVDGWEKPIIVIGHRNAKTGSKHTYVNHEQAVHMRKELGLGDEIPRWYEIAFIG